MREKSQDQAFAFFSCCALDEPIDDLLMAYMHAVKSTQGNDGFLLGLECGYGIEDFQNAVLLLANLWDNFDNGQ